MCSPLVTGLAKGISPLGALVDPLNLTGAFVKKAPAPPPPDPAVERASAEAEAAQRANTQLALNNKRRREQGSLMSKGALSSPPTPGTTTQFAMGDATTDPGSNALSTMGATTRNTTAQRASLISRGSPTTNGSRNMVPGSGYRSAL